MVFVLSLIFIPDHPRFFVFVKVVTPLAKGHALDGEFELGPDVFQRSRPKFGVAIVQLGIKMLPELIRQIPAKKQPVLKSGEAVLLQQRFSQPNRQLQILALLGDGFLNQLDDQNMVRQLAFVLPRALVEFVILAARFLDLVVDGRVPQILAARVVAGDGRQDIFTQGHRLQTRWIERSTTKSLRHPPGTFSALREIHDPRRRPPTRCRVPATAIRPASSRRTGKPQV